MRNVTSLALSVIVVGVVAGCGGEEKPAQEPTVPSAAATTPVATTAPTEAPKKEEPKESLSQLEEKAVHGMADAMNSHDTRKLAGFYAEGGVVKIAGAPSDASGREAIAQSYEKLFQAFPDYKMGASRVFQKGDTVVVEWVFNGTHKGDLWGIKASEKKVGAQGLDILWFTPEGTVKEHHVYYDGGTILSQIGVSPQKGRAIPAIPASAQTIASSGSPDEQKNVDVAKAMNTAMEAKKEADFLATMDDKVEWDDLSQPVTSKGKADAKKYLKEMSIGFPDMKGTTTNTWAFGDFVITEGSWTGTHKGSFFGMAPTKKSVTIRSADVMQFKDGKLVHGWGYSNGADFMMQLGKMPKPGAPAGDKKPADTKAGAPKAEKK